MTAVMLLLGRLWASPKLRVALLIALAIGIVAVTHLVAYHTGISRGAAKAHTEDTLREQAAVAAAESRYRAQEMANEKRVETIRVEFAERQATELAVDNRAASDLASGSRRVRVQVTRCSSSPAAPGPAAARADGPETAELAPETAASLYAIAADCDANTRQLTALQDWAKSAVLLCNGQSERGKP